MSPRAKAHLKLAMKFGSRDAGQTASMSGGQPVPSGHLPSLRPEANSLNPDIPLFLIGKNKSGFWVAREENGSAGGIFFTEHGARQFVKRWAKPLGCATMRVSEPLELDVKDDGNVFIALLATFASDGNHRVPESLRDVLAVVLGLAAVAIAVWLTVTLLTLGR